MTERTWKVGDSYEVVDTIDGRSVEVTGHITRIDEEGYHVTWTGPECIVCGKTIETKPDPRTRRP